ncbi:MAG: HRDC domain-containing protein [Hahellaceae bacterium]|nr:HRDC domain-containing protein [Hahellaceae bacterium]
MNTWVDSASALQAMVERCSAAAVLGIDSEFMRGSQFYPQPCVLQLGDGEHQWLVDLLQPLDWSSLLPVMAHPSQVHVYHACSEDLEILQRLSLPLPSGLFDTQVAASMAGLGFNLSLQALVEQVLSVHLPKDSTRTDWAQRPLAAEQLTYAAQDVVHLPVLQAFLAARLDEQGKTAWFNEEMETLKQRATMLETGDPDSYLKLRGGWRLSRKQQWLLAQLVQLRETWARKANAPRKWVCSDDGLINIARTRPVNLKSLQRTSEMVPKWLESFGQEVLVKLPEWEHMPVPDGFQDIPGNLPRHTKELMQSLRDLISAVAASVDVPEGLLANRAMIESTVRWMIRAEEAPSLLMEGWRGELLRSKIVQLSDQWLQGACVE